MTQTTSYPVITNALREIIRLSEGDVGDSSRKIYEIAEEALKSEKMNVWEVVDSFGDKHVMPIDDLRPHESSMRCFCKPVWDHIGGNVAVHNAMDEREQYERGRKLS